MIPYPINHFARYPLSVKYFGYSFNPEQDNACKLDLGAGSRLIHSNKGKNP